MYDVHFEAALSSMYVQLQSNLFFMVGFMCDRPVVLPLISFLMYPPNDVSVCVCTHASIVFLYRLQIFIGRPQ